MGVHILIRGTDNVSVILLVVVDILQKEFVFEFPEAVGIAEALGLVEAVGIAEALGLVEAVGIAEDRNIHNIHIEVVEYIEVVEDNNNSLMLLLTS